MANPAPKPALSAPNASPRLWRRLAAFAAISIALHLVAGLIVQALGLRKPPAPAPEPMPVALIEPPPAATPSPAAEPEQPPAPAPEPAPPAEPETRPEPQQQAQETPAPEPTAEPEPERESEPQQQAEAPQTPTQMVAPRDEEGEAGQAEAVIPGLRYGGGRGGGALSAFLHAVECASINIRYEDYCADIGPIYLAERDPARLSPDIEEVWRRQAIQDELMMVPIPQGDGSIPDFEEFEKRNMTLRQHLGLMDKN